MATPCQHKLNPACMVDPFTRCNLTEGRPAFTSRALQPVIPQHPPCITKDATRDAGQCDTSCAIPRLASVAPATASHHHVISPILAPAYSYPS